MSFSRRKFFAIAGASAAGTLMASPLEGLLARKAFGQKLGRGYGPLLPDPNGLLELPRGFQYRTFSLTGDLMNDGTLVAGGHDGMAAFGGPRNTVILVRNHELSPGSSTQVIGPRPYDPLCKGGTTTLVVGSNRQLIKHFTSLSGTYRNCAGGLTPWGSWISCEENTSTVATNNPENPTNNVSTSHGYNFEVPASTTSAVQPEPLIAMGRFNHEAVAVDPKTGIVYETEDRGDSLFYRFIPKKPGNLKAGGTLQALKIKGMPQAITGEGFPLRKPMKVEWVNIPDPNPAEDNVRVQGFNLGAAQFVRGEGIWYGNGEIYFCCTSGGALRLGQVWRYIPHKETIELFVESTSVDELDSPDNIVVSPYEDLILCEDGDGEQFLRGVTPKGELYNFARNALNTNEFAGACFSPDGKTMFVNIQTPGITFAIWGPWNSKRG
ncbi:alkaline phosphatase PhoX [Halotia wernerae UHCC 0503]|nr:alkaline phosphatase PhoX [Halotia wernerae UHCC 0503]